MGSGGEAAGERPEEGSRNLRRFLAYARPYRWLISLVVVLGITRYVLQFVTPWGVGVLLDGALMRLDTLTGADRAAAVAQVHQVSLILIGALLARCVAQYGESVLMSRVGNRVVFDLRRHLYTHLHRLSQRFFDTHQVGSIGSRVLNDISVAQNLIGSGVISVVIDTVALAFTVLVLLRLEWRLTLIACVIMPGYVAGLRWLNPQIRALSKEIQEKFSEISGTVFERLAGMQVVQAFTQERASERQFVHETRGHYDRQVRRTTMNARLNFLTTFLTGTGTILLLWWGGQLVLAGQLTAGMLVQFYSYVTYLYGPLSRFAELNQVYQNSMGAVDRVFEILDTEPDVAEGGDGAAGERLAGHVRFEKVSFEYEEGRPILHEIDLDAQPGQMVAFVGPSGSGKTTMTKLLLRFYDVSGGAIRIDGRDLRELPLRELRRQVGVVLQEPILFTGSVRHNIALGRRGATDEEIVQAAKAANAHDFIMELPEGYDTLVGERGAHLSGGQRQRVSIARALLKDPRILILDEATSSLDSESERLIQEALGRLMEGRTSFVVAHRLSTIVNADQILVLDRGRVVERGTHDELLLRNGLYAELCAKQFIGQESAEGDAWASIRVEEVMNREPSPVPEELPLEEVFTLMQVTHQHGFPVTDADGRLSGLVTLSDVEDALYGGDPGTTVGEICSRDLLVCYPDQTVAEAVRQLEGRDVGRLPVVDPRDPGRLLGMLRRADVVLAYSRIAAAAPEPRAGELPGGAPSESLGDLRFFRVCLTPGSPAAGRQVRELSLPRDCVLVSVRRGDEALVPRGDTRLEAGDCVFVLGHADCACALRGELAEAVTPC
ncbi:MAG: ABC transporter transmembrane domain-containing protein [Armatimonadota bacterium]